MILTAQKTEEEEEVIRKKPSCHAKFFFFLLLRISVLHVYSAVSSTVNAWRALRKEKEEEEVSKSVPGAQRSSERLGRRRRRASWPLRSPHACNAGHLCV